MTRILFAIGAFILGCFPVTAAIILADHGKTDYFIAYDLHSQDKLMNQAVQDLADYLQKATNATFPICKEGKGPKIVIDVIPETDKEPMQPRERRIRTVGKDLYIYGDYRYGTIGAIYDFLQKKCGCRWYTNLGDEKVPHYQKLTVEAYYSHIPSFKSIEWGPFRQLTLNNPLLENFVRRNNAFTMPNYARGEKDDAWKYIGPTTHTIHAYLPPGGLKPGTFNDKGKFFAGPHPALADKAYFKEHPEYYTLLENGKRDPFRQLCFTNPDVRRLLLQNIETALQYEKVDANSFAVMDLSQNDKNGGFCHCPNCVAKTKQYQTPGGPYFDFLLEVSSHFEARYPKLLFRFFVYQDDMTGIPPVGIPHFPKNLSPILAPIQQDFSKPLTHPYNLYFLRQLESWGKLCDEIWFWNYPNHYPHGMFVYALLSNVYRNIENMRLGYNVGVRYIIGEQGGGVAHSQAFKDLNIWVQCQLGDDIHQDADALIKEFCDFVYDDASEMMQAYIKELDELSKQDPGYFVYWHDPRLLKLIYTPQNLVRWEKMFDEMEARLADKPLKLRHVRRARINLDAGVVMLYSDIAKACPDYARTESLEKVYDRYLDELNEDADLEYPNIENDVVNWEKNNYLMQFVDQGLRPFYEFHKKGPQQFPKELIEKYGRENLLMVPMLPQRYFPNFRSDSPTGFAVKCPYWEEKNLGFLKIYMGKKKEFSWLKTTFIPFEESPLLKSNQPDYQAHPGFNARFCGEVQLSPSGALLLLQKNSTRAARAFIGFYYNPENPEQKYDAYLSLADNGDCVLVAGVILAKKSEN